MPNGYTGGFEIERGDFIDVLRVVPGDCVVGMGLSVAPVEQLGDISASEMIRWLNGCKQGCLGVEQEHNDRYTAFIHLEQTVDRRAQVLGLVINPSSPIHGSFRARLRRKP